MMQMIPLAMRVANRAPAPFLQNVARKVSMNRASGRHGDCESLLRYD